MYRYVTEIALPAPVYMRLDERKALGEPEYYGCRKAYWAIYSEMDDLGTPRPLGIRLIAELEAVNLESAEDTALQVGLRFSQVLATYSGSPLQSPRLNRLGRIGDSGGLFQQYDYYYLEGPDALPRVLLRPHGLERLLSWFGRLDEPTVYRLELAARWYGMSVGAQDPLDAFLAVWIGLESVGAVFGTRVHEKGPKVSCNICGNQAGINRDRGEAGIEHAIKEVTPELLAGRSLMDLKRLRSDIAHGLKPAQPLRLEAEKSLPDLQLALIFAILTRARPETSAPRSGRAILPRNFKIYPDARSGILSEMELINHKPFFGEWLDVQRRLSNQRSRLESDGNYIWGARTGIGVEGRVPTGSPELKREYVIFERMGRLWEDLESDEEHPAIPVVPWRATTLSSAWEHYLTGQDS